MSRKVFLKACEVFADDYITFGGGEPTLHPRFWEFLGIALSCAEDIFIVTNGSQTRTAIRLARLAKKGVIGTALSRDEYHSAIDKKVVEAFTIPPKKPYSFEPYNDRREIRPVNTIIDVGRAEGWGDNNDCACNDLFITPEGKIYGCGCKTECFGTVFDFEIPEDYQIGDCSRMKEAA